MYDHIYSFFHSEITCIPSVISSVFGDYYNNALCNMSAWAVAVWCLIHYVFDRGLQGLFKMQKYKEYVRTRLVTSLWYWGFYSVALIYCGTTLAYSQIELFNFKKMRVVPSNRAPPLQVVVGYTLISTFYQHSFLWESISMSSNSFINMWKYLCLATACGLSYTLRVPEICFTLTALSAISQVLIESTRLLYILLNGDNLWSNLVLWFSFVVAFSTYLAIHVVVIPLTFILPLGLKVFSDYPDVLVIFLLLSLIMWLILEFYNSILFQFFEHCFYHNNKTVQVYHCIGHVLECGLFPPRNDDVFNITVMRKEIEEREKERLSKRRPKNRNVLIQTLKCMVAIKKKLTHRKLIDSSDSDDSEKSESNAKKIEKDESEANSSESESDAESDSSELDDDSNEEEVRSVLPVLHKDDHKHLAMEDEKNKNLAHCHAFTETLAEAKTTGANKHNNKHEQDMEPKDAPDKEDKVSQTKKSTSPSSTQEQGNMTNPDSSHSANKKVGFSNNQNTNSINPTKNNVSQTKESTSAMSTQEQGNRASPDPSPSKHKKVGFNASTDNKTSMKDNVSQAKESTSPKSTEEQGSRTTPDSSVSVKKKVGFNKSTNSKNPSHSPCSSDSESEGNKSNPVRRRRPTLLPKANTNNEDDLNNLSTSASNESNTVSVTRSPSASSNRSCGSGIRNVSPNRFTGANKNNESDSASPSNESNIRSVSPSPSASSNKSCGSGTIDVSPTRLTGSNEIYESDISPSTSNESNTITVSRTPSATSKKSCGSASRSPSPINLTGPSRNYGGNSQKAGPSSTQSIATDTTESHVAKKDDQIED